MCYNDGMNTAKKHWSVDETELKKDLERYAIWRLEQRINFGLGEEKLNRAELKKYWDKIDIDPFKRKALALALE
ncbi:MAG: hypothetical protein UX89_C0002G0062 [Parcubacteria group bacterium GW2011_GWA2_47_16]|nr:MAG: hypothetical protein UX89_C0002G0062 [Parcubacteria group bacterium GW2011_GWA2_47_16]